MGKQKNATPGKAQQEVLKQNGLNVLVWVVIKELGHSMIIKHRVTGEVKVIEKANERKGCCHG